ncbi:MAG: hypothetical protein GC171_10490 [Terrimonas sp.]|nr:hypothetical protein [Terrimonas sp.]
MKNCIGWLLLYCLITSGFSLSAQSKEMISVSVHPENGSYQVSFTALQKTFTGSLGQPLHDLHTRMGKDAIGAYSSVTFTWKDRIQYEGRIRWYTYQPVVIFDLTLPEGAREHPMAFPVFDMPDLPYHFSYHNRIFPLAQFFLEETSTPWLLYNEKADACIISPASDFIVSMMTHNDSTVISSGLNPEVKNLPSHFTHSTIMVMENGIRKSWDRWGDALRALYQRSRPANDADAVLNFFGYWTDNGADYYYDYDTAKGYAGTLLAVREHYNQRGIPLGYMQLDSWWYQKSLYNIENKKGAPQKKKEYPAGPWNRSGGMMEYKADTFLFPEGLAAFQKKLGLPLITHNRWMDSSSPYHEKYKISGYTAIDPAFWDHIMAYLKQSGVINYEQDWMNYMYTRNPEMIADVSIGNAFTDGMAQAAKKYGINMQYCMALPRYFMQGVKYNNLTTIRASGDGFMPKRWKYFIFTSQLAYAMGIWPWSDVFKSYETGNMILSVLSAGPVGTGDALGLEDKANILMACRDDGVLVKPDLPMLPLDINYLQMARGEEKPILGATYTLHGEIKTGYVFVFAEEATKISRFAFRPMDIGIDDDAVVFDPLRNKLQVVKKGDAFRDELPADRYTYFIVAPVTSSGIAFLGDAGKITATGKKRISQISCQENQLTISVVFAEGETAVTLRGYAKKPLQSDKGKLHWDPASHLFTLVVPAPQSGKTVTLNLNSMQ